MSLARSNARMRTWSPHGSEWNSSSGGASRRRACGTGSPSAAIESSSSRFMKRR